VHHRTALLVAKFLDGCESEWGKKITVEVVKRGAASTLMEYIAARSNSLIPRGAHQAC
jgi:hypothetical protein